MGLIKSVLRGSGPVASGTLSPQPTYVERHFWGTGTEATHAGVNVGRDTAMKISTVYAATNLLAKVIASVDTIMQKKIPGGWADAPEHPITDLLAYAPNSYMTAFEFKAQMMYNLVSRGVSYAAIYAGSRGSVDSLVPLNPDCVRPRWLPGRELAFDVNDPMAGVSGRLLQDEIFRIRSPISRNGITGLSPMACAQQTYGIALAAEEHAARMFNQGARPSGVIEIAKSFSDEAYERFKESLLENHEGLKNGNKTLILEEGATFRAVEMTADQIQFLQLRAFTVEEICRWFDVPAVLLHHTDKSTSFGTGIEQVMIAFVVNNLMPWIVAWQQAMSRDIITAPKIYRALFDVQTLLRGDSAALSKFIQTLVYAGVLTRNDGRVILGYNPLDGLDEPLVPVTAAAPNDKPVPGESDPQEEDPTDPNSPDNTSDPSSPKPPGKGNNSGMAMPLPRNRNR